MEKREKRLGVVAILVENRDKIADLNLLLTHYNDMILGRMGLPIRERHVQIISLIVQGDTDEVGALTGKIGKLSGIHVKSVLTKFREHDDDNGKTEFY